MDTRKPKQPYLLRAFYDWIVDSELTPYIVVAANSDAVQVPREFVEGGRIVLNIAPLAVRNLAIGDDYLEFDGRFSGNPFAVSVPITAVTTIYAKETGEGMMFEQEGEPGTPPDSPASPDSTKTRDHLKIVK